jgi:hypothetical protein
MLIGGMAAAVVGLTTLTPFAPRNNMRFDLQQNVMCLAYEHPLLLERSRGWTPKNHFLAVEKPQRPHPENGGAVTTVEPEDIYRFEGEGGPEAPVAATELIAIPLENAIWQRSAAL